MTEMHETEYFYLVWCEGNMDSRARHASVADARKEAERLALVAPGKRFYVLRACGFAVKESARWTECSNDPEIPF